MTAPLPNSDLLVRMTGLGAHLVALASTLKRPINDGWPLARALPVEDADIHLDRGGNVGVNLAASAMICLDAENFAATGAVTGAGFIPTVIPAKSQTEHAIDPAKDKRGGTHTWLRVPDGIDPWELRSDRTGISLPNGGIIDVLAGHRQAVAPPSQLAEAPGYMYVPALGGPLDPSSGVADIAVAPMWLFDPRVPGCPPELSPLNGILAPKTAYERVEAESRSQELTDRIDEIPWSRWLDGDPRLQPTDQVDACGCEIRHWQGAENDKSVTLHDGCDKGCGAHVWSGTMIGSTGADADHFSRLNLATLLKYGSITKENRRTVAASVGLQLGGSHEELAPIRPEHFTEAARESETLRQPARAERFREAADQLRASMPPDVDAGEIGSHSRIGGGVPVPPVIDRSDQRPALTLVPPIGNLTMLPGAEAGALVSDDAEEHLSEDTGLTLLRRIDDIDVSGFWETLPILRVIARAADSNGVGRWGLLGAVLPRIACSIPPHVRLVNSAGEEGGPNSGASLNLNSILTGPPEEGKSETIKLAADLVPLPKHAGKATTGTGEGIIKSFGYMRKARSAGGDDEADTAAEPAPEPADGTAPKIENLEGLDRFSAAYDSGYEFVHITDTVMLVAAEISGMIAEMGRQGTKATSVYRSTWVGEEVGTTAGEVERRTFLEPHSYRFCSVLGSQVDLDALGPIFKEAKLGSPQRFGFFPVCTVRASGVPMQEISFTPVDWTDGAPVAVSISELLNDVKPVWIHRPPAAHAEIEANRDARRARRHLAYSTSEVFRRAEDDDQIEDIRGHELLHQLKYAAILAVGDGLREPTDAHWHAAGVIMHVRQLVVETLAKVLAAQQEVADRKRGRSHGRSQAEAKRAELAAAREYDLEVAERIREVIADLGGTASEAAVIRKLGKAQASAAPGVIRAMIEGETLAVAGTNNRGKPLFRVVAA